VWPIRNANHSDLNDLLLSPVKKTNPPVMADAHSLMDVGGMHKHLRKTVFVCILVTNFFSPYWHIDCVSHERRHTEMQQMKRDWYVVYSKPRKEEQVQLHLGLKGIESFFPRLQMAASTTRRRAITPLFPNYLFVRIALASEAHYVIWSPGVKRIVSFSDTPIPLDDDIVGFLKARADARGVIHAQSQLSAGQQVEITGGPFNGFVGIIENPPNAKGRVKILLKLLSRQISVKLGVEFIRNPSVAIVPAATLNDNAVLSAGS
jgi:transcription elongation factor/antiterminator RfaH